MPRYEYECQECEIKIKVFHTFLDTYEDCYACETSGSMKKNLSRPYISSKSNTQRDDQKVGDLTKQKIEENRAVLEQQKKEAKDKYYVKT
jgi:predicted nucleic acid-binding Zn ribbon protein